MGAYLSAPNTEKIFEDSGTPSTAYGAASMQGWRTSQEDAHNCCPDFDCETETKLFAVYDGHGGSEVAQYCAVHLPDFIRSTKAYASGELDSALKEAFLDMDSKLTDAAVVEELRVLAGIDEGEEGPDDNSDEITQLKLEANMPISELMKRYSHDKGGAGDGSKKEPKGSMLSPVRRLPNGHGVLSGKLANSSSYGPQQEAGENAGGEEEDDVFTKDKCQPVGFVPEAPGQAASSSSGDGDAAVVDVPMSAVDHTPRSGDAASSTTSATEDDAACCSSSTTEDAPDGGPSCVAALCDSSTEATAGPSNEMPSSRAGGEASEMLSSVAASVDEAAVGSSSKISADVLHLDSLPSSSGLGGMEELEGPSCSSSSGHKTAKDCEDSSDSDNDDEDEEEVWSSDDDSEDDNDEGGEDKEDDDDDDDECEGDGALLLKKHIALARTMGDDDEAPGAESGCTACVALIRGNSDIYVANAGDSRCVLSSAGRAVDLSCDHKPDDAEETKRIARAGGHITPDGRVNGGLNLSRAIGDHAYKRNKDLPLAEQMITALPDIMHHKITKDDEFLVIACDGIWNSMTSQEVVTFVRERLLKPGPPTKLSEICGDLFDACLSEDTLGDGTGCDNMTCIIVKLNDGQLPAAVQQPRTKRSDSEKDSSEEPQDKRPRVSVSETE